MSGPSIQEYTQLGRTVGTPQTQRPEPTAPEPSSGPSFGEALESALSSADQSIKRAESAATDYISGQGGELHNVLLDMERADLEFRTIMQVRNKLIDAYQEIMRISV